MLRDLVWRNVEGTTVEHVRFDAQGDRRAESLLVGVLGGRAVRLRYELWIDADWRTRALRLTDVLTGRLSLELTSDGEGRWRSGGAERPDLDGCIDVDLTCTPLTNVLPVRRLGSHVGLTQVIDVAWVDVATGPTVSRVRQRYTCLGVERDEASWHFESDDFEREITVDADGFVLHYPGLFERVLPR